MKQPKFEFIEEAGYHPESLLDQCLRGNVEANEIPAYMGTLMPVVDDPRTIAHLVEIFLRKKIEAAFISQEREMAYGGDSREVLPVTDEYADEKIFQHPDAKFYLHELIDIGRSISLERGYDVKLEGLPPGSPFDGGFVHEMRRPLDDPSLAAPNESFGRSKISADRTNEDVAAETWINILASYESKAPFRDYDKEFKDKARQRISDGKFAKEDLVRHLDLFIELFGDTQSIKIAVERVVEVTYRAALEHQLSAGYMDLDMEEVRGNMLEFLERAIESIEASEAEYDEVNLGVWKLAVQEMKQSNAVS